MELTRKTLLRAGVAFAFAWACTPEEQDPDGDHGDAGHDAGGGDAGGDGGNPPGGDGGADGGQDAGPGDLFDGGQDAGPKEDAGDDAGTGGPSCTQNGTVVVISANHGHELVVSKEDVEAGVEKTYDIRGVSGHVHLVTLTAAHFATLSANGAVQVNSTEEGSLHFHEVSVSCA